MSRMIDKVLTKRAGGVSQTVDLDARTATFVFSTNSTDRAGDIIDQATWNLDRYKANPQFLWAHRSRELPIGRTIELTVKGNKLIGKVQFATAEENPFADICWNLVKGGYLSAVSVGFIPHRWETYEDDGQMGMKLFDCELLECSLVPIPCNQDCLLGSKDMAGSDILRRACDEALASYDDSLQHVFGKDELATAIIKTFGSVTISGNAPQSAIDLAKSQLINGPVHPLALGGSAGTSSLGVTANPAPSVDGQGTKEVRLKPEVSTDENEPVYDSSGELMGLMIGGALKMARTYQDKLRERNLASIGEQAGITKKPATTERQAGSVTRTFFLRNAKAAARRRRAAIGM